jgi:UDP-N-acetyl-D-glucosamine dehydrogenase
VALTPRNIASFDCILLATNHTAFDYKGLKKHAKLIVDTRGIYLKPAKNIVKA